MKLIVFFLFTCTFVFAQNGINKEDKLHTTGTFIGIDAYENTYYVTDNIVMKSGANSGFQFSDIQLGNVTSVDILNPLKIVAYYNDFNTVVFLDNRLNEIERISFNDLPSFINTSTATNAGNNRLWILNTDTQQVELYNYSTQQRIEISQPITDEIKDFASNFNYFFLLTNKEVRQYNIYGGLLNVFKISEGEKITQDNENIVVMTTNQLLHKSNESDKFTPLDYQEILPLNLHLRQDLLYIYNGKNIATFSLNKPKK